MNVNLRHMALITVSYSPGNVHKYIAEHTQAHTSARIRTRVCASALAHTHMQTRTHTLNDRGHREMKVLYVHMSHWHSYVLDCIGIDIF